MTTNLGIALRFTYCAIVTAALILSATRADAASCPIKLESVVDVGRAASGAYESYQAAVSGKEGTVSSIDFVLRTSDSQRAANTAWQDVTLAQDLRVVYKWKTPRSLGTFDRLIPDLSAAAIVRVVQSSGSPPIDCDPVWKSVTNVQSEFGPFITQVDTINDSAHSLNASVQSYQSHARVAAKLLSRPVLNYSGLQANMGVQGIAIVDVGFDATVKPNRFWLNGSSQDDALDASALSAARLTKYTPPLVDGRPDDDSWYQISFVFGEGNASFAPQDACPAQVSALRTMNVGQPDNPDWYRIFASTARKDVASILVGIETRLGRNQRCRGTP